MEYYTVRQVDNNECIADYPILFNSYSQAQSYVNKLLSSNIDYLIIHNKLLQRYVDESSSEYESNQHESSYQTQYSYQPETSYEGHLKNYDLSEDGKGYMLRSHDKTKCDPYFFGKDYDGGWWRENKQGWFFKSKDYQKLVDMGAQIIHTSKSKVDTPNANSVLHKVKSVNHESTQNLDLSDYNIREYGKGYILSHPSGSHFNKGYFFSPDFDSGWWMDHQLGWFFKKSHLDYLEENGASFLESETTDTSNDSHQFSNLDASVINTIRQSKWISYGRGWLLKPTSKNSLKGTKYLLGDYKHGGWWCDNQKGWIFRTKGKEETSTL